MIRCAIRAGVVGPAGDHVASTRAVLSDKPAMPQVRLVACVLLPFAAGYYLSYLFRSINALIAGDLAADLDLGAHDLGLLTAVYFLSLAAVQLPLGGLLDRYGPKIVQSLLLLLASVGALLFALAEHVLALLLGRALIGLGVAMALMAGFKAIVLWFPPQRVSMATSRPAIAVHVLQVGRIGPNRVATADRVVGRPQLQSAYAAWPAVMGTGTAAAHAPAWGPAWPR